MRFKRNVLVRSLDGKEFGRVSRVVLDPKHLEVTHIIVHRGGPLSEDKVVPVDMVGAANDEQVTLRTAIAQLEAMPPFESGRFVNAQGDAAGKGSEWAPSLHWIPMWGPVPPVPEAQPVAEKERHIPPGTVALKAGARVIAADGKVVGKVEGVLTDSQEDRATEFMVARGGAIRKTVRRVPVRWVYEVKEGEVHLAVGSHTVQELNPQHA